MSDQKPPSAKDDIKAIGRDLGNLDQHTSLKVAAWAVNVSKAAAKFAAAKVMGLFRSRDETN